MYNKGSCQCGAIAFEFESSYFLTLCHCRICQKLHGSAFTPMLHGESKTFQWLQGKLSTIALAVSCSCPQTSGRDTCLEGRCLHHPPSRLSTDPDGDRLDAAGVSRDFLCLYRVDLTKDEIA